MAHEQSATYAGHFTDEEIAVRLQPLLEAERAGARISKESSEPLPAALNNLAGYLNHLKEDETRYCKMLLDQIKILGAKPSEKTGDFYEKCIKISDLAERLTFLNRGQNWVVKKLDELLPRIGDPNLILALREMRETHVENMKLADLEVEKLTRD